MLMPVRIWCPCQRHKRLFLAALVLPASLYLILYFGSFLPDHPPPTCPSCPAAAPAEVQLKDLSAQNASGGGKPEHQPPGEKDTSWLMPKKVHLPDDWPRFFVPRSERQFSMDYPYVHRASRACGAGSASGAVDVLVMILSTPGNLRERQTIRDTWGSVVGSRSWPGKGNGSSPTTPLTRTLALVFLLAEERPARPNVSEAVRRESEKYGDVVQWAGLRDSYFNLTMKVLMGLQWAAQFCPNVSRVAKTDDDTFVHVPRLLTRLQSPSTEDLIWGPYFPTSRTAPCMRAGKYAVSREAYPFDLYPPHVKGNLYVLPGRAVAAMARVAPYLPYNNMEDTHVTGTLARVLGLRHQGFSRREFSTLPQAPGPCLFEENRDALGSQWVSPDLALRFWRSLSGLAPCRDK